jgi:hypothetical protein
MAKQSAADFFCTVLFFYKAYPQLYLFFNTVQKRWWLLIVTVIFKD